jgi:hypothetical protein
MPYAVIALTGDVRGDIVKRAILARQNRAFIGSLTECRCWIAGSQCVLADLDASSTEPMMLAVVPWGDIVEAS